MGVKSKSNIFWIIFSFLLLIPFRLPITILFIRLLNNIATLEGTVISNDILAANVLVTKLIYNIVFSVLFIINIEKQSRIIMGRKPRFANYGSDEAMYWWTALLIVFWSVYLIFDAYWTGILTQLVY